jgi:hypothetical protein
MNVFVVTNLDAKDLSELRNGKRYEMQDLEHMVDWFNERQQHWGAGDLVKMGCELLAEQLCEHHGI